MNGSNGNHNSQGIEELIEQLKNKGVSAGKEESVRIVADAEKRAEWIIAQAREEAERVKTRAKEEAEFIEKAGRDALHVAYRDVLLRLKDELSGQFSDQLKKLVQHELESPDTLKLLLYAAVSKTDIPDQDMTLVISQPKLASSKAMLPEHAMGLDELREHPESLKFGPLLELLSEVTRSMLSSKVRFKPSANSDTGITFVMRENNMEVDLSDHALTELLLTHLQPRFRAILEGVVV